MNNRSKPVSVEYVHLESQGIQKFIVGENREVPEENVEGSRNEENYEENNSIGKALFT